MQVLRRLFQTAFLLMVVYLAMGWGLRSFEAYCPFGGAESLYALITSRQATCALGPWNLGVFFGVLVLTLVAKKAFCSWVCPLGFLLELLGKLRTVVLKDRWQVPRTVDAWLRSLRWVVLVAVLVPTWKTGELVFRGYDPFYLVASGMGPYSLGGISVAVLVGVVVLGFIVPMAWCRYLCPMSALMDIPSALSPTALKRDAAACTGCLRCDRVCAHGLMPSARARIRHVDCSNCLACVQQCSQDNALSLELGNPLGRSTP